MSYEQFSKKLQLNQTGKIRLSRQFFSIFDWH